MNRHYLPLILFCVCFLPTSALYLNGCQAKTPIEQNSNSNSNLGSEQVTAQPELSGIVAKIKARAETITVRIDTYNSNGSGVIVAHQGETYYVLTAEHVVAKEQEYKIVTLDGQQYPIDYSQVKKIAGSDLAVVKFTSQQDYQVATLANYKSKQEEMLEAMSVAASNPETAQANLHKIGEEYAQIFEKTQNLIPWLFLFGWQRQQDMPQPRLTAGRDVTLRKTLLSEENQAATVFKDISAATEEKGYQLSYTNFSQGGMSGGAVLDSQGRLIGIHSAAEGERVGLREIQLGLSLGIPIQTFLSSAKQAGIQPEWLKVETSPPPLITAADKQAITESLFEVTSLTANAKATDWINYGNELWRLFQYEEAIAAFEQAIALQPDLAQAHYGKAISLRDRAEFKAIGIGNLEQLEELDAEAETIELDRAGYEEALAAFIKTTELDPNFETAWQEQGVLLNELGRHPEALAAYDKAIALNPNNDHLHYLRGSLLLQLFRHAEAVEAFNKAIALQPSAIYYMARMSASMFMGDSQKMEADLERVREIDPELLGKYPLPNN